MLFRAKIMLNKQNPLESNDVEQSGNVIAKIRYGDDISASEDDALLALALVGPTLTDDSVFFAEKQIAF
jgi:hypothetical protein